MINLQNVDSFFYSTYTWQSFEKCSCFGFANVYMLPCGITPAGDSHNSLSLALFGIIKMPSGVFFMAMIHAGVRSLSFLTEKCGQRNKAHTGITLLPRFSHFNLSSLARCILVHLIPSARFYIHFSLFRQPADARVSQIDLPRLFYCHKTLRAGRWKPATFCVAFKSRFLRRFFKTRGHKLECVYYIPCGLPSDQGKNSYCVLF